MSQPTDPPVTPGATRCPRCDSPSPNLHPAVQWEGEVQPCPDPWHFQTGTPGATRSRLEAILREYSDSPNELVPQPYRDDIHMLVAELHRLTRQLAEQRAELEGRMSEHWRAEPSRYDTPEDHYREMARRFCESRDELKHENRKLKEDVERLTRQQARLCELAESWRKRSHNADHFAEFNPNAAQDLKDSAKGQWYAFDECATELRAALAPEETPP